MPVAGVIAAVAAVAGAAAGAYSAVKAGEAGEYNAKVAEANAITAQNKAAYEEELHRERVKKIISTQQALYGKSGVSMEGSPLLTIEDTAAQGELDALAIRYGGDVEAAKQRSAANLSRMNAGTTRTAGYMQAGSSLLSGAAKVSGYK